jgi:hypothetical protein
MPVFDTVAVNHTVWSAEPLAVTQERPGTVNSRCISRWPDDDFLCWSIRQKDAEIVVEYDV